MEACHLSKVFCIIALVFSSTAIAADFKEYRKDQSHYGIALPADWHYSSENSDMIATASSGLASINVTVEPYSSQNRRKIRSISDEPNMVQRCIDTLKNALKADVLQTGKTVLSNNDAVWLKYVFVQKSLDIEPWFVAYSAIAIRNDNIYTVTARAAGRSKREALAMFDKTWPIFKISIVSLFIDP
jgi:hypothetical protein